MIQMLQALSPYLREAILWSPPRIYSFFTFDNFGDNVQRFHTAHVVGI